MSRNRNVGSGTERQNCPQRVTPPGEVGYLGSSLRKQLAGVYTAYDRQREPAVSQERGVIRVCL